MLGCCDQLIGKINQGLFIFYSGEGIQANIKPPSQLTQNNLKMLHKRSKTLCETF